MIIPYKVMQPQLHPSVYMAEGAKLIGDLTMGEESTIWFNAVLRADLAPIVIGRRCNIQDNAVGHVNTDQPLILDDDVSVGHSAIIHGCRIGTGSLIGMGAILLNGAEIGEYTLIGAGSVVTENTKIPPYTLALGTPAKVIRELTDADLERMSRTTLGYVAKGKEYRSS
ncbi:MULTISPECIES: gamma carbonic anhydrase family protein [Paenibacillus]|uniref:Carbonic anhydrase/acetyltransferase-like protein (Isoleucine patch superfamily) n=1 Tax=Paenibacillus pabuli TaxID=1472 RepID=A0A855XZJ4_9BACL|nr:MULTISPECIES: gamma carbonic anhydrase family protein [Paenibacillus]PWW44022.1 carbonic anhydrase/acetyltransferase-like protein (isoleucine patch superfamily) [Paenibacillus pabuli]PXW10051.1 carbonic anhydrase/acetyltransferase-like protein (isoleucine patch superfamily) [Paenibacillus taichungensis]